MWKHTQTDDETSGSEMPRDAEAGDPGRSNKRDLGRTKKTVARQAKLLACPRETHSQTDTRLTLTRLERRESSQPHIVSVLESDSQFMSLRESDVGKTHDYHKFVKSIHAPDAIITAHDSRASWVKYHEFVTSPSA